MAPHLLAGVKLPSISGFIVLCTVFGFSPVLAHPQAEHLDISIVVTLQTVKTATFDGRDYLTLDIGEHHVGPSACRSNVLTMDSNNAQDPELQQQIEAIALTAMITGDKVLIDVPLTSSHCVEGKPTFTNVYPLPITF